MHSEDPKMLEFNQYQKFDKATFVICTYPQYHHLKLWRMSIRYTEVKTVSKSYVNL